MKLTTAFLMCTLLACQRSETRFAVEFPPQSGPDRYLIVDERSLTSTEIPASSLRPLPGHNHPQITLKLDFTIDRNKVVTIVYAIPPETDGHKHWLATHSARLYETIDLQELKKIGYQPFTLKIVSSKPRSRTPPTIVNNVPSIQVNLAGQDLRGCTLLLRNVSSRGVVAYVFDESRGSISMARTTSNFYGHSVIAPGAAKQVYQLTDARLPRRITLAAAVFTDGSHEGDGRLAAQLESGQIGYRTQYRRISPAIDRLIHDPALDDDRRVARIQETLHSLSNQPDAATIRALQSQFPDLPHQAVVDDLSDGLDSARRNIWSEVYGYVHSSGTYPPPSHPPPLADWWLSRY
jgi:hypothetical protein